LETGAAIVDGPETEDEACATRPTGLETHGVGSPAGVTAAALAAGMAAPERAPTGAPDAATAAGPAGATGAAELAVQPLAASAANTRAAPHDPIDPNRRMAPLSDSPS
jgi:hypothetical protein